uniref:Urease accessory protein UreH-like transmembrane domain-containing protein n=1 Tax=mine drainage metagenome TaxID=410659 RepID=E6PCI1_9ZZZZ
MPMLSPQALLILAVGVVGVLHTMVPDHWAPIALLARRRKWSQLQVGRAALLAGLGHTLSTLVIATIVWAGGMYVAQRFGHLLGILSSVALVAFGLWIAIAGWREMREHDRAHAHGHAHEHDDGRSRGALLVILGSSPMIEGIPAFFAASRYGVAQLVTMSIVFAASTMLTYLALCLLSSAGLARLQFGRFERYGEVISGLFIALLGAFFAVFPAL